MAPMIRHGAYNKYKIGRILLRGWDMDDSWFPILFWSGPIGLGVFFAGLGVLFWGIGKSREGEKKSKDDKGSTSMPESK